MLLWRPMPVFSLPYLKQEDVKFSWSTLYLGNWLLHPATGLPTTGALAGAGTVPPPRNRRRRPPTWRRCPRNRKRRPQPPAMTTIPSSTLARPVPPPPSPPAKRPTTTVGAAWRTMLGNRSTIDHNEVTTAFFIQSVAMFCYGCLLKVVRACLRSG